jgi:hypothetical protein
MSSLQYVETNFDTKHFAVFDSSLGGGGGGGGIAKIIMVGGGGGDGSGQVCKISRKSRNDLRGIEGNKSGGGNSGKYYTFTRNTK